MFSINVFNDQSENHVFKQFLFLRKKHIHITRAVVDDNINLQSSESVTLSSTL